jgi:tetratricopeptide (TPR) repeat protein
MSENLGSTQPNIKTNKSAPIKSARGRTFLFNALGLIIILVLAVLGGYGSGIRVRRNTQSSVLAQQLGEQFQFALVDIQFGRYANARQRLEFIIANDPTFPGAPQKLTEVLVLINVPTPTLTPVPTTTPDFTGAEQAFTRAQQLIAAQDWTGAISALDEMRKLDPNYQTSLVDGMYYFALRNYGYNQITSQGNLEGGIYQLTLAERFGPLDRDSNGLREGARYYLIGASFWELDWEQALFYFDQVYRGWSGLWDGTMTATERYHFAAMRYADQLLGDGQACDAVSYYEAAQSIAPLDNLASEGYAEAYSTCFPPTEVVTPTLSTPITPTLGGPAITPTDTKPGPPITDTPSPTLTETPTPTP